MNEANGPVAIPETELAALRPARVRVIYADPASLAAFGSNPLDPATRASSARAGRQQGRRIAADLVAFLSDPAAGAETP
jgi:NTE family protein